MAFEPHKKTEEGRFRKERSDSSMEKLRREYPVLNNLHKNFKTLGAVEEALGVDSLSQVIKEARKIK